MENGTRISWQNTWSTSAASTSLPGEEVLSDLHRRTGNKVEILRELLAGEFLTVGSGRFEE